MPRRKHKGPLYELQPVPMEKVIEYQKHEIGNPFVIRLKVPKEEEKFLDDNRHYTKSNINVCYAAPRSPKAPRNWYETQMSVSVDVRSQAGYPYKGISFYAVTDDGYGFLAHTISANNKQWAAVGNELILGRWLKSRLVEAGLVEPVEDVSKDKERKGMITQEMLEEYGCNAAAFQKTDMYISDPVHPLDTYEVWTLKLIWIEEDG